MSVKMPEKPKFPKGLLIYLLIATAIFTILLFSEGVGMVEYKIKGYFQLLAVFDGVPLAFYLCFFIPECRRYILSKTNYEQYVKEEEERQRKRAAAQAQARAAEKTRQEHIERERQIAIASQQNDSPWAIKYCTYPCPHCGHYKVRYAKWEDKRASVAFWGIHSSKLGTNYKCECCGEMWE
ncbi:MAG: hypothetical protein IJN56_07835 [Clostridia bacterium]|nr:hypothetical protein [Clostridia bacterium]